MLTQTRTRGQMADTQRESVDRQLKFQRDQYERQRRDALVDAEQRRRDSLRLVEEQHVLQNWPLRLFPSQLLGRAGDAAKSLSGAPTPLVILLSMPASQTVEGQALDIQGHVRNRLHQFLATHYSQNGSPRPVQLLDFAWKDPNHRGGAAIKALYDRLDCLSTLVLEADLVQDALPFQFAWWGPLQEGYQYQHLGEFDWRDLLTDSARERARQWRETRAELIRTGQAADAAEADRVFGGENTDNLRILEQEERLQVAIPSVRLPHYAFAKEDFASLYRHLSAWYCLAAALVADLHHFRYNDALPQLPDLLPGLLKGTLFPQAVVVDLLLDAYAPLGSERPDLAGQLAQVIARLPVSPLLQARLVQLESIAEVQAQAAGLVSRVKPETLRRDRMSANPVSEVIGFDFGDAETALSRMSVTQSNSSPEEIFSKLARNDNGIIKTVVGYRSNNDVVIGQAAATCRDLKAGGLHVGFKKVPVAGDKEYENLARDFIDRLFEHLYDEGLVAPKNSQVIIGHPSKWTRIDNGAPVKVLKSIVATTQLGKKMGFDLVPESRGAMVEAIDSGLFKGHALQGWALVIDLGSSTTDFTAVNRREKRSTPLDDGEELGARLIDRAISSSLIAQCDRKHEVESLFRDYPEEAARFELWCREYKERYFSGQEVEEAYLIKVGSRTLMIAVSLTHETMQNILSRQTLFELDGQHLNWQDGFKRVLMHVKQSLAEKGVEPITAILLTGGASRMGFVKETCKEVFPSVKDEIAQSGKPQFTIANGLARWGKLQIHTEKFEREIEEFCSGKIEPAVDVKIDDLFVRLAKMIADRLIVMIKEDFAKWKSGQYRTIATMNGKITSNIDHWLKTGLPQEIGHETAPWIAGIAAPLAHEIQVLEQRYNIPIGTLGGSLSVIDGNKLRSDVNMRDIDLTGSAGEALGNFVGVISGLVASVVAFYVIPIVLGIVVYIISLISTTLAGLLLAILTTNPAGWVILAAIGIAGIAVGAAAKDVMKEKMQDYDLPTWVRDLVKTSSIHQKIDGKHDEIVNEVLTQLKGQKTLRAQILDETTNLFSRKLREAAEEARMLIR